MAVIVTMLQEAQSLLDAISRGDSEQVEAACRRFRDAVEAAWDRYQRGEITTSVRGLPRAMYLWATRELPLKVQDPSRWDEARRELAQFIRTVERVVEPKEA